MLMSMEEVASREVVRLGNQLLEFETEERNRPLRGLPEKLLKTKGRQIKADKNADEYGISRLAWGFVAEPSASQVRNRRTKSSLAGITREVAENKGTEKSKGKGDRGVRWQVLGVRRTKGEVPGKDESPRVRSRGSAISFSSSKLTSEIVPCGDYPRSC